MGGGGAEGRGRRERKRVREREGGEGGGEILYLEDDGFRPWPNLPAGPR